MITKWVSNFLSNNVQSTFNRKVYVILIVILEEDLCLNVNKHIDKKKKKKK